jgi:hypothetical protein
MSCGWDNALPVIGFREENMLAIVKRYFLIGLAASLVLLGLAACGTDEPILGIGGKQTTVTPAPATTSQATVAPVATPRIAKADKGRLVDIFPELADLPDSATGLTVQDNWSGMSPFSPTAAKYTLRRSGSLFEGEGQVSIGIDDGRIPKVTKIIKVPSDTSREFLRILIETPVEAGAYRGSPIATYTDNYPDLKFSVTTPDGTLSFSSTSQRDDFYPWTIWYNGKQYTSTDGKPHRAYLEIAVYLKQRGTLDIIRSEIEHNLKATPRP